MQSNDSCSLKPKKFEFPGSTVHYSPLLSFTIDYMWLQIKPDFGFNTLKDCVQKFKITACKDINEIQLDIAEIEIHQVISSSDDIDVVSYDVLQKEDKLIIKLGRTLHIH